MSNRENALVFGAIRRAVGVARGLDKAPYYEGRLQAASVRRAIRLAIGSDKA